jgi:ribonuclease-3
MLNFLKKIFFGLKTPGQNKFQELEQHIGYTFKSKSILEQALSHRSYAFAVSNSKLMSNERLEFLGDALLGFVISHYLFDKYPHYGEGELSRIKSLIISRKALKEAADRIHLGDYLLLSHSEEKTGGRNRFSINTNAFEAVVAAVYLDGGFQTARRFIKRHVVTLLKDLLRDEDFFNYKSKLLEIIQAKSDEVPKYSVVKEVGPDHNKTFEISVTFWGKEYGAGEGKNKKEAEQIAARNAIENLEKSKEIFDLSDLK